MTVPRLYVYRIEVSDTPKRISPFGLCLGAGTSPRGLRRGPDRAPFAVWRI